METLEKPWKFSDEYFCNYLQLNLASLQGCLVVFLPGFKMWSPLKNTGNNENVQFKTKALHHWDSNEIIKEIRTTSCVQSFLHLSHERCLFTVNFWKLNLFTNICFLDFYRLVINVCWNLNWLMAHIMEFAFVAINRVFWHH